VPDTRALLGAEVACQSGDWQKNIQYTRFCYTDVLALYYAEGLNEGKVPYKDHAVEYPVVTGYFMGALGLPVHAYGVKHPNINQGTWFYNANALVLSALAVATAAVILRCAAAGRGMRRSSRCRRSSS